MSFVMEESVFGALFVKKEETNEPRCKDLRNFRVFCR
jgi:hypothetical protein